MEHWNQIVTAAMMGTDKSPVNAAALPVELSGAAAIITANTAIGKEEQFMQLAALLMNFRQCGVSAMPDPGISQSCAPVETMSYCSVQAMQALKDVLSEDIDSLIELWLECCTQNQQLIHPGYVPAMLEQGTQHKKWQPMVTACCGKRGEWLSQFNESWKFSANQTVDDAWQTGSPEQRKQVLRIQRADNPQQAITMLQAVWPQEDANTKQGFLALLHEHISADDLPFLEPLLAEKSKKVRAEVVKLLLLISSSGLIKKYEVALKKLVVLQKEKTLLGMSSKMKLYLEPSSILQKELAELGIEAKSSRHGYSDEEFIFFQLIQSVQPVFWEDHLQLPGEKIIELFQSHSMGDKLMPALVLATVDNKDQRWGELISKHSKMDYIDLLPLLPKEEREARMLRYFEKSTDAIMQAAFQSESVWSLPITTKILSQFATNPYQYTKNMLQKHIRLIPDEAVNILPTIVPAEDYKATMWRNTSDHIKQLLRLRKEITNAFNA